MYTCASPFPRLRLAAFPAWTRTYSLLCLVSHTHPCSYAPCGEGGGRGVRELLCHKVNSPQPGRLGPEGSGGGGAGPHSPSDKYVFGAAVLKGHGGEEEGWSAPRGASGSQPGPGGVV